MLQREKLRHQVVKVTARKARSQDLNTAHVSLLHNRIFDGTTIRPTNEAQVLILTLLFNLWDDGEQVSFLSYISIK